MRTKYPTEDLWYVDMDVVKTSYNGSSIFQKSHNFTSMNSNGVLVCTRKQINRLKHRLNLCGNATFMCKTKFGQN